MKNLTVNLPENRYNINIEKGSIEKIGREIKKLYKGKKIAIITDENLNRLHGAKLFKSLEEEEFSVHKVVIEPGEKSKCAEVLFQVYDKLLDFGMTRGDLIIAFGGGVVGDLAGFAASTLLRGIPYIQIPTSLLAQIDSSIGGKVAVDLPRGKNLVGSFYHPRAVFIDPELLKTLDPRFLHDGMGEVIKYGAIRDKIMFSELEKYNSDEELLDNIEDIIYICCNIKRQIVENDEKDTGERMLLNFGHTIGHAIEKYFNFQTYSHGEAVAIGMYAITKKSEEQGITEKGSAEKIKALISKYSLPFETGKVDNNKIIEAIGMDKKNNGSRMNVVLLKSIGDSFIYNIDAKEVVNFI